MARVKILVVEDESIVAKDIKDTLKNQGYDVLAIALSGEEAIQKAGQLQPDLVLMDIVLKGDMDGIATAEQIHDRFGIPVVYLTAYTDEQTIKRAKITEPFAYITKPFDKRELRINIEMALYKHKTEEALRAANQQLEASEQQLKAANQQLNASNQQLRASEEELRKLNHDLGERVKELNCLYGLSQLVEQRDIALEKIFQGLAELIPPGWHYPEITCARVVFEDQEFKTANFKKTKWKQSADIKVSGRKAGAIEVYYLKKCPMLDEGPFLKEERNLIDVISRQLSEAIERKKAEEILRAANQQLTANEQQLKAANEQLTASEQQLKASNQQLIANEQQLKASNQQLTANEQQLKASNQQLRASEEEARALAKFPSENPNPVLRIAKNSIVIYSNEAGLALLTAWGTQVGRRLPHAWRKFVGDVFNSTSNKDTEFEYDGSVLFLTFAPVVDFDYVNVYGLDITERKKAEHKLLDYQIELKSLASELALTEERERYQIATELHSSIGQSLVISKIKLDELRTSAPSKHIAETLEEVCNSLDQTIQETKSLTFDLSSPILYELGFEAAVAEWLTERIQEEHGIATQFEDDGQPKPLDDDIRAILFRDVRELLINVVKHARAKKTKVSVRRVGKRICVTVEDDGVGFDPVEAASMVVKRAAFGLFSVRERLEQLGGHLEIESAPGRGCRATITAPLKQE